jgi:predicted transcriptional regulator
VAMLPTMLEHERRQAGWSVGRAAWALGVSIREYRELEAGLRSPGFETRDRICKLFGWPQTFPISPSGTR